MEWVKLIATPAYYLDGALLRAGEAAEVLFCRALAHCGGAETGGLVDKTVLPMLVPTKAKARADALVRVGLWLDEGDYYRIRSWDKWQDEHDAAADRRRKDRERKREKRRAESADNPPDVSADVPQTLSESDAECRALDVEGDVEGERTQRTTSVVAPRKRAAQGTRIPDTWPLDDDHAAKLRTWAVEHTPVVNLRAESENWQDWHRAKGDTAKDWTASWRTWMRRAQADAERGGRPGTGLSLARPAARPSASEAAATAALEAGARVAARHSAQEGA